MGLGLQEAIVTLRHFLEPVYVGIPDHRHRTFDRELLGESVVCSQCESVSMQRAVYTEYRVLPEASQQTRLSHFPLW